MGCPHQCTFCNQWQSTSTRTIPVADAVKETVEEYLSSIRKNINHIEIAFFGGSFTGIDQSLQIELLKTAEYYKNRDFIQGIRLSTRPDYIDDASLKLLKKYGVTTIELGAQSFDDSVLKKSNRGHSGAQIIESSKRIKDKGFNLVIQLMPGLPGDTKEKSLASARQAVELNPDSVRIYPTVVLKNTELEKMYRNNQFTPLTIEEAIDVSKDMYAIFQKNNIDVIRIGIHPFSKDEEETIIKGPYHPSFGFFVKARLKRDILQKNIMDSLSSNPQHKPVKMKLYLPEKEKEEYVGFKRENILFLERMFGVGIEYDFSEYDTVIIHQWQ